LSTEHKAAARPWYEAGRTYDASGRALYPFDVIGAYTSNVMSCLKYGSSKFNGDWAILMGTCRMWGRCMIHPMSMSGCLQMIGLS
jgi:hypothetical protein